MISKCYVETRLELDSFDRFMRIFRHTHIAEQPCVVCGYYQEVDSDRSVVPKRFSNTASAIIACAKGGLHVNIFQRASNILVTTYCKGVIKYFEIHVLNDKGIRVDENRCDITRREYQLTLKDYLI
jgi:hypothetical protein